MLYRHTETCSSNDNDRVNRWHISVERIKINVSCSLFYNQIATLDGEEF